MSRGWNVTYDIKPPLSGPPYQAPHIKPPISSPPYLAPHIKPPNASPLQYQDPISGHPFQYETADLPYEAPTYNIKPLVLDVQNESPTYDIKLFELNRQYRKCQNRQPTNQATINDIRPIVLDFQNEALTYDISSPSIGNMKPPTYHIGPRPTISSPSY